MTYLPRQSAQLRLVVLLIIAASCFRVSVCFLHNPMNYLFSDMLRHWNNGLTFPRGGYTGGSDPIIYQVYIGVLHKVIDDSRFLVGLMSAVLSVLMPWTYYRAARNVGLQKLSALWVWALIAWTPSLVTIYHYIMMETLLLFLEGVSLWMTARYLRWGGTGAFLVSAFCWTITCLTKPTVVPLAGICLLWSWGKRSTPLRDLAIAAAMAIILLLPQSIRSKVELGFVAPFGNPWLTRIQLRSGARSMYVHFFGHADDRIALRTKDVQMTFLSPSCTIGLMSPFSNWAIRRAFQDSTVRVIIDSRHGERDWKLAYTAVNDDRDEWMAQWRENIVLFFFAPSWPEMEIRQWDDRLEFLDRWLWAPLIAFVFAANIRHFLKRQFDLIPVAVTLFTLLLALQNVVLMEGRYRKVAEPLLLLNLVWVISSKRLSMPDREDNRIQHQGVRRLCDLKRRQHVFPSPN